MDGNSKNHDIEIRTMKSDIEAIKASGGDATSMQFVKLAEEKVVSAKEAKISIGAPGYTGPEQAIFTTTGEVKATAAETVKAKSSLKIIIIAIITIVAVAGLGFLAYNLALSLLKK